jgi:hypothetical protein
MLENFFYKEKKKKINKKHNYKYIHIFYKKKTLFI